MIFDNKKNAALYEALSENFRTAFEFMRTHDMSSLEEGRHEIDGDRDFVNIGKTELKPWNDGLWEVHRKYADIQLVISGRERIGIRLLHDGDIVKVQYKDDIMFYEDSPAENSYADLTPDEFAVFLPYEMHRPCIRINENDDYSMKAVFKVLVNE